MRIGELGVGGCGDQDALNQREFEVAKTSALVRNRSRKVNVLGACYLAIDSCCDVDVSSIVGRICFGCCFILGSRLVLGNGWRML
jgi:hypothetical protein